VGLAAATLTLAHRPHFFGEFHELAAAELIVVILIKSIEDFRWTGTSGLPAALAIAASYA